MDRKDARAIPEYVSTGFIARRCGVSITTVLRWIADGKLPAFSLPSGHYRVGRDDFSEFLAKYGTPVRKQMSEEKHGGQAND